jgi:hypothetical protein
MSPSGQCRLGDGHSLGQRHVSLAKPWQDLLGTVPVLFGGRLLRDSTGPVGRVSLSQCPDLFDALLSPEYRFKPNPQSHQTCFRRAALVTRAVASGTLLSRDLIALSHWLNS